jgi:hypothetical protein
VTGDEFFLRNVDVLCTRKTCQTAFVTSYDTILHSEAVCPKCSESWAVHMTYEDGRLIHPIDECPTCQKPTLLMERCRCTLHDTKCVDGHESHVCPVHKIRVAGEHDHKSKGCTCEGASGV